MWKPAERIKYQPSPGHWPTPDEAQRARLFQGLTYQSLHLDQRTWVPAMVPWRASADGETSEAVIEWYRRFAQGKPGAIVVEATGIRDVASGPLLRIGHDRYLPGLKRIVDAVRDASDGETRLFIQLIDFLTIRRRVPQQKFLQQFLKISELHRQQLQLPASTPDEQVRSALLQLPDEELAEVLDPRDHRDMTHGYRERVTDTDNKAIAELPHYLPKLFAQAATRAEQAGFDGVELHFAHAYTMASFLSPTNTRTDGYGSTKEGRIRLPMHVYQEVRRNTGKGFVVGARFLSEECISGGVTLSDSSWYAEQFAQAGMDFLSLSRGGKFDDAKRPKLGEAAYPYTGPSGYECMPQYISDAFGPFGRNIDPVAQIRAGVRKAGFDTPIVVAGGIHNFEQAEAILKSNQADIIGFARQSLADPDWFRKVKSGYGKDVVLCEYTNYCEGLDQKHKQVTCNLWDRSQLEPDTPMTSDGKRRRVAPDWIPVTQLD